MGTDILIYLGGLALLDMLSPTIIGVTLFLVLTDNIKIIDIFIYGCAIVFFLRYHYDVRSKFYYRSILNYFSK